MKFLLCLSLLVATAFAANTNTKSVECDICKDIIHDLGDWITEHGTEDDLIDIAKDVSYKKKKKN